MRIFREGCRHDGVALLDVDDPEQGIEHVIAAARAAHARRLLPRKKVPEPVAHVSLRSLMILSVRLDPN